MSVTSAFLNTCRTLIVASAEYTAFNTAMAAYGSASRSTRATYWQAVYGDGATTSPAYLFRKAIRDIVTDQAASTVGGPDREEAVRTLTTEFVPQARRPRDYNEESAELQAAILEDQLS